MFLSAAPARRRRPWHCGVRASRRATTSSGSMTLPFTLVILSPFSSTTMACRNTVAERHLPHEVEAHHHHARDPEEEDVVAGLQDRRRVERRERARLLGPAQRRERPQRRREPGVEHVVVLRAARSPPHLRTRRASSRATVIVAALGAVPRRDRGGPTRAGARCTSPGCCVIQWKYVFVQLSGTNLVLPCSHRRDRRLGQRLQS